MKANIPRGIAIILILTAICTFVGYGISYPIELNMVTLPENIKEYYNRGKTVEDSPAIVLYSGGVSIGKEEYYLVEVGEKLGSVTLEKGPIGRYKFIHLGYGDGNFLDGIIENEGKKYLLFGGLDTTSQIYKITVLIEGQTYDLYTETVKDRFLLCTEIDRYVEDSHVDRGHIRFYNEKGEDITEFYDLSGGGIS